MKAASPIFAAADLSFLRSYGIATFDLAAEQEKVQDDVRAATLAMQRREQREATQKARMWLACFVWSACLWGGFFWWLKH